VRRAIAPRIATTAAVVAGVLLGGCATVKNTPAQNLAHQRLAQCNRFTSVVLRSLALDGSMIVFTRGAGAVSEYPAWRGCMEEALAEQKKQGNLPSDAQPSIVEIKEGR
jgi:hypothetical protein